jgi:methylthioribose-1-phosphate isomerase
MIKKVIGLEDQSVAAKKETLEREATRIQKEDARICRAIGENFMPLLRDGISLLTHCNAGSLATARYGTATSPMYIAKERGWEITVYSGETRPYLQGARLTTYELQKAGIKVILICDSAAGVVMSQGRVDAVITGADRVVANGDVANKVGTASLAVLANHYGIPFYVAVPTPTVDLNTPTGESIPIEERDPREVTHWKDQQVAPDGVSVYNPAFDVTHHELVSAIVTEKGVVYPPFREGLRAHLKETETGDRILDQPSQV